MSGLAQIAPTETESKALSNWLKLPGSCSTDLAEPEQVLAVVSSIPTFQGKVTALIFKQQYGDIMSHAMAALKTIDEACAQVSLHPTMHKCPCSVLQPTAKAVKLL